jgi:hypothetical protein
MIRRTEHARNSSQNEAFRRLAALGGAILRPRSPPYYQYVPVSDTEHALDAKRRLTLPFGRRFEKNYAVLFRCPTAVAADMADAARNG